ncbi:MAG: prepilin-type N-terminal cleavage/methylation domain-containing protein [Candidatus Omnitrophota bacterium]|jgi:prepilin-type N-terminal cleavage/methylation domain-containing protein
MKKYFHDKKGLTLVEVLVSVILIAVIIVAMVAAVTQGTVYSKRIEHVYTATYIANRRVDLLKRLGFAQVSSAEETDVRVDADGNMSETGNYVRTTGIDTGYGGNPSLTKVKVTVNRVKVYMDGTINDPVTGEITFMGQPIVMETLFSDIE